ncbi:MULTISPECIES: bifunctional 5,10-methylenetetrahydrofolate dehydrogenase/5,10-methenyltetrahydrofolate cyclohydrolase [Aerococcus]|uniref:bifunctional 5,10-methylenetetrahydrofolate dehydrogenase/5,10-methenyltetrahydrofolate cyclohydrolase n=1 Tax=Aerococcus TaxID=1375 RepID=UPI0018A7A1BC|nr:MULTISPECIES: bifunctional 5,10-methylenetetrahydrofolate dehydrogenase/5,10-methenyltetrahydrofolate cyclohydrolase [Aerococcus]MCY3036092.1 bifunctional 5,10-methylenetetrahydrofolate dehydrogenase/5,10-methenyltetrahydrofolate cyclohydrolase [Aerococcus sp. Group 2]MCY3040048.1 bifunctional 5,10-methylenetetrahydrofolate dehydrogenase/5,10-methenyltetrahydrofolate cyclohydrolase [Aerococcus sp. Group 2]MCY3040762.1 bifunctional 5,10-methylenetetrahydrofolate dehydrogenase/5,10-methenyltetr
MQALQAKTITEPLKADLSQRVAALKDQGIQPRMVTFLVESDDASAAYAKVKGRLAEKLGVIYDFISLKESTSTGELVQAIKEKNADPNIHGVMVEMPLPKHIDEQAVIEAIAPEKDLDGLHPLNLGYLLKGTPKMIPNTALSALRLIEASGIEIAGKQAVVIGRSNIVGKPLSQLLLSRHATVTVCHSHTKDLTAISQAADILCVAIGKPHFIQADMVKEGAVVIDIGTNYDEKGKVSGDVDFEALESKQGFLTPVPGGVGPLTTTLIFDQLIRAIETRVINE